MIKNIRETIKLNNIGEHSLFCKDTYITVVCKKNGPCAKKVTPCAKK